MRILHFSDIHLPPLLRSVPLTDWFSKRIIGGLNLLLGRGASFAEGPGKVAALDRFRREIAADLVICTGDYTALGTRGELRKAREIVQPLTEAPLGYADVPGNHDFYTSEFLSGRRWREDFDDSFGGTFETDLPEYVVEGGRWPFARLLGGEVAVAGVNSSRPNLPWQSSGKISPPQLDALRRLLADKALGGRFVFVITHYAPRLENGGPDRRLHGLVNADEFLAVCANLRRGAILCGHVHRRYMVRVAGVAPAIFCAGSATKAGGEGLWVFDVEGSRARATPGGWQDDRYVLDADAAVDV